MLRVDMKADTRRIITRISAILISRLMLNLRDPMVTNPMGLLVYPLSRENIFVMQSIGTAMDTSTEIESVAH